MKKLTAIILAAALMLALAACSGDSGKNYNQNKNSVNSILENGGEAPTDPPTAAATEKPAAVKAPSTDVDVDLTALDSNMIYSEVQNMIVNPKEYVGKSVRMTGDFSAAEYNGKTYFACIIRDATACCANGIEFVWKGNHAYPDDYPAMGTAITVVGDFDTYMEGEQMYIQLIDAELEY